MKVLKISFENSNVKKIMDKDNKSLYDFCLESYKILEDSIPKCQNTQLKCYLSYNSDFETYADYENINDSYSNKCIIEFIKNNSLKLDFSFKLDVIGADITFKHDFGDGDIKFYSKKIDAIIKTRDLKNFLDELENILHNNTSKTKFKIDLEELVAKYEFIDDNYEF